ncbi:MAG: chloride channel protein [Porphyromonadaceae bacterium]|nr:chloride channel protein [Porphyromonadaceae bacterium]
MKQDMFLKILVWREKHIKEKNFVIMLSFLIGVLGALAALILKGAIYLIQKLLTDHFSIESANYLYLIYPIIGIGLSWIYVHYIVKDDISHGVTRVLYAISQRKSRLKPHNMYSSIISSSITIGFGGSVGAEAPIVYTGAAIGSNLGKLFRLDQRVLMLLVGCGAAAGIAGIFKAPFAGLLFTIEVLMIDLTATSIMPLIVASATAATITYIISGQGAQFAIDHTQIFSFNRLPYVLILGILCGFVSYYFTHMTYFLEGIFNKLKKPIWKFLLGAVVLSAIIFVLPPLYGEGYDFIQKLLNGQIDTITNESLFFAWKDNFAILTIFLALIILLKVFATAMTTGGGGVGGTFAPSLYVGCVFGFLFAFTVNHFHLFATPLSTTNFALMGMAGVMSGVMHAPLMAFFLTAELTGSYDLFLPLMITSAVAFWTIRLFDTHNLYTLRLAQRGELITHHKDKAVLTLLKVDSVIETDFLPVHPDMTLGDMVKVISQSHRNSFPVLDQNGILLGIVLLDDIRNIMFRTELYERFKVSTFMIIPPGKIEINMPMEQVMKIFDETNAWNLPVVDSEGKYLGFVSKSKIFNSYRRVLVHFSQD